MRRTSIYLFLFIGAAAAAAAASTSQVKQSDHQHNTDTHQQNMRIGFNIGENGMDWEECRYQLDSATSTLKYIILANSH